MQVGILAVLLMSGSVPKTITVLHTTDLHANVAAWDYLTASPDPKRGLAKATSVIRAHTTPCTLIIDTGDTLQGAPLGPEAMAGAMNRVGYAAMALGNHDFNFGQEVLRQFVSDAQFPVLAANVSGFPQWIMRDTCGVRVGILGLVTPMVKVWERPEHIEGLTFASALATAKKLVPEIKKAGADVVVIAIHAGPNTTEENEAGAIAQQVPNVDVILTGHLHTMIPKLLINGVILSMPNRWGSHVGETTIVWNGRVVSKDSRLHPVDAAAEAADVIAAVKPQHDKTIAAMQQPLGEAKDVFEGGDRARFRDSALSDLINAAQTEAAASAGFPVDASGAAIFSDRGRLPKGRLTMRDIYGVYPYDNTLWVLELKREDFKATLEQDALFFKQVSDPLPQTPNEVKAPGDNFDWDIYSGLDYTIDITKPAGQRVDLRAPATVRVALNNYRANGGDGYDMLKRAKVLWKSQQTVRDMLAAYVKSHSPLTPTATPNFRLVPDLYTHFFSRVLPYASSGMVGTPAGER